MPVCTCGWEQEGGKFCQDCGRKFATDSVEAELVIGLYGSYNSGEMEEVYGDQADLSEDQWYSVAGWAEHEGVDVRIRVATDGSVTVLGLAEKDEEK